MMIASKTRTEAELKQRQQAAVKHGGSAAVARLHDGRPFTGLAHAEEQRVRDHFELTGQHEIILENAVRLQAATNLYWDAVCKAAEDRNLDALDRYIARYGWLASATLRAWTAMPKDKSSMDITTILRGNTHDDTED